MAPTYQPTSYSNIYSNQSMNWSNDWSSNDWYDQSGSNASSSDMSNYWASYDPDYWPTFQPSYQQTTTTNPYYSTDLSMSMPPMMETQQSLPDFIALMSQHQTDYGQDQGYPENFVEGVVDSRQLREELTFLARRKKDERKKLGLEEERQKKMEAMREEEKERLVSASYQLPMFDSNWQLTVGRKPWLSDNYINSRFFS